MPSKRIDTRGYCTTSVPSKLSSSVQGGNPSPPDTTSRTRRGIQSVSCARQPAESRARDQRNVTDEDEAEAEEVEGTSPRSHTPALSSMELRLLVGRERQRLLALLQEGKPSAKKVAKVLQRLGRYRADFPNDPASDWLAALAQVSPGALPAARAGTRTLCLGCGDGSYEVALCLAGYPGLTVTFFDDERRLRTRYSNYAVNALVLRSLGAEVLFAVDATALRASLAESRGLSTVASPTVAMGAREEARATLVPAGPAAGLGASVETASEGEGAAAAAEVAAVVQVQATPAVAAAAAAEVVVPPAAANTGYHEFSRIIFNFPQTGQHFPGTPKWHEDHAVLLRSFFRNVAESGLLHEPAEVWVTLMDRAPYSELRLDAWAAEARFAKQRRFRFDGGVFGLYRHRMTNFDKVVQEDDDSTCHVYSPVAHDVVLAGDGCAHGTTTKPRAVCYGFSREGRCKYGAACRFEHAE